MSHGYVKVIPCSPPALQPTEGTCALKGKEPVSLPCPPIAGMSWRQASVVRQEREVLHLDRLGEKDGCLGLCGRITSQPIE